MSLVGKIKTLFSDKEKTEPMFPRTKVKAVSDDEGVGLNVILENMVYSSEMVDGTSTVPVNADTLGGKPADEYALGVEVDAQVDELRKKAGKIVAGETFTIDGTSITAGEGAEIFNDYKGNKATGMCSHAEGIITEASGDYSHAEGNGSKASDIGSHAEGVQTTASGAFSHSEGLNTTASGRGAHAEGNETTASGGYSHVEGCFSTASGIYSHAEGYKTTASGENSHAEGERTTASGEASHAGGYWTTASNVASMAIGKYSKAMTDGGSSNNQVGDVFVIGNGKSLASASNALRVTYGGATYGLSAFNASGADYAEFFEWLDGNPEAEDRIGLFVTLDGGKIVKANTGDYILGIVSGNPCIVGNSDEDWLNRWEKDEFGRFIKEEVHTPVTERKEVEIDVLNEDGNPTGEKIIEMQEVETGEYTVGWRYKQNPDYDSAQAYVERKDRQEWDYIGMLGVLPVIDDGTCQVNGYCKVADGGTATASDTGYRVICRVSDNVVKVVFR